mmetsp:Transcript_39151/g.104984  ORF Transcript_39151/g.104984 Transcript_39151/m.104984 type:complete len:232 (-) Transcript_39151:731-1426(-)
MCSAVNPPSADGRASSACRSGAWLSSTFTTSAWPDKAANCSGVYRSTADSSRSNACGLGASCSSTSAASAQLLATASSSGVEALSARVLWRSRADLSEESSSSVRTTEAWPSAAAKCSGAKPTASAVASMVSVSPPRGSSASTAGTLPLMAAKWSGMPPPPDSEHSSSPTLGERSRRAPMTSMSPLRAASCSFGSFAAAVGATIAGDSSSFLRNSSFSCCRRLNSFGFFIR